MGFRVVRFTAVIIFPVLLGCSQVNEPQGGNREYSTLLDSFPDFITANKDYFIARIGDAPQVNADSFRLEITGLVGTPKSFFLRDLMSLPRVTVPVTIECEGNWENGPLVGTAIWKGFRVYDLLKSLGLDTNATGVQYKCADGYYASHTLDQIKNNNVIGALFMNGDTIPPEQGFPLRILSPGFYGVKQPAWVVGMEVSGQPLSDYWGDFGWDLSPPMAIDSKIFFPSSGDTVVTGDTLYVGGAAFGGTRVARVEVTTDSGNSWKNAEIIQSMDADNVWVFWLAKLVLVQIGTVQINARATDIHGSSQPATDPSGNDGLNGWPVVTVSVVDTLRNSK